MARLKEAKKRRILPVCEHFLPTSNASIEKNSNFMSVVEHIELDPAAKIIVSSGYADDPVMANYRKYGFKGVIEKPYRIEAVKEMLWKIVNG